MTDTFLAWWLDCEGRRAGLEAVRLVETRGTFGTWVTPSTFVPMLPVMSVSTPTLNRRWRDAVLADAGLLGQHP